MRRYSNLRALPLSFFSSDLYRDVAAGWKGAGVLYLLLVAALLTLIVAIEIESGLIGWARGEGAQLTSQIPRIVIRHRVVEVDAPLPFTLRDPQTKAILAVVDTNATIESMDAQITGALLTADRLIVRRSAADTRVYSLANVKDFTIDRARAQGWLRALVIWAGPVAAPFVLMSFFVLRLAQLLPFALFGLLVGRGFGVKADFPTHMRLAAVALTPALLIEPLLDLARIKPGTWAYLWTAIAIAYVAWAERCNRPRATTAEPAETSEPPTPA